MTDTPKFKAGDLVRPRGQWPVFRDIGLIVRMEGPYALVRWRRRKARPSVDEWSRLKNIKPAKPETISSAEKLWLVKFQLELSAGGGADA